MRQCTVPQLVQRERATSDPGGVPVEQLGCSPVGQPGPPGGRVDVECRHRRLGLAVGQKQRPGTSTGQHPRQQPHGARLPHDHIAGTALAGHRGTPSPEAVDLPLYPNEQINAYRSAAPAVIGLRGSCRPTRCISKGGSQPGAWLDTHLTGAGKLLDIAQVQL